MSDLSDLQTIAGLWHRARFPTARMEHVALKLCEEAGEVGRAVNGLCGANDARGGWGAGEVLDEAADVVIALLVLMDRWVAGDLTEAVRAKLAVLSDPNSGHRARAVQP